MGEIFVISDTHHGHENIIKHGERPFSSVEEMDEIMIENWNSVVTDQDKVYHLGDVYMGSQKNADSILSRLRGKKRLILGNHDNGKDSVLQKHFKKIDLWRLFKEHGLMLTHVPIHQSCLEKRVGDTVAKRALNIHGHIHQNPSPEGPYRCVCVEQINYRPISIEELRV